jgi:hypothetical protein
MEQRGFLRFPPRDAIQERLGVAKREEACPPTARTIREDRNIHRLEAGVGGGVGHDGTTIRPRPDPTVIGPARPAGAAPWPSKSEVLTIAIVRPTPELRGIEGTLVGLRELRAGQGCADFFSSAVFPLSNGLRNVNRSLRRLSNCRWFIASPSKLRGRQGVFPVVKGFIPSSRPCSRDFILPK